MADIKTRNEKEQEQGQHRGVARRPGPELDLFGYNPFSMARRLSEEMDRAFASAFGLSHGSPERGMWSPPVEVRERNGNIEICAELPGMNKEDIKVECTAEGISIEGEKRKEQESDEGGFHRSERIYGHFFRMIPLPEGIDPSKIKAEFKNGVLQIHAPIPERLRKDARQIPVNG